MSDSKSNPMYIGYNKFNIFFISRPRRLVQPVYLTVYLKNENGSYS